MTEKPILFSGTMVRAVLDGRKTQTRRVVKPQPDRRTTEVSISRDLWMGCGPSSNGTGTAQWDSWRRAQFVAGDRLWVRETWQRLPNVTLYRASPETYRPYEEPDVRWRSSIHMPRAMSRILLEVTSVRVERLQDISEDDSWAEGCPEDATWPVDWYRDFWNSLNAARGYGWDVNPWVWVVEFRRVTP